VDRIAHNDLVDALPYVDAYNSQLKAQVDAVVRAEMSTFQPSSDYLTPLLASSADSAFIRPYRRGACSVSVHADSLLPCSGLAGEPVGELDVEYSVKPLRSNTSSEADVAAYGDKCKIVAAYEQARIDALELSHRYGAALWTARIDSLQRQLQAETAALKQTQKAIDRLNADRAAAQTRASERLYASEREFHALCAKNVELSRVICTLQAEVDELQQRN
jgi:hypothetical protein